MKNQQLTNILRYILRAITGLGNGAYFGFSVWVILFFYIAPITGGLSIIIPAVAAASCATFFIARNIRQEIREQAAEKEAQLLNNNRQADLLESSKNKELAKLQIINQQKQTEAKSFAAKSWVLFKKTLTRGREFLNASKNAIKTVRNTLLLFGVALPVLILCNPAVATVVGLGVLGFATLNALDYHLRRKRNYANQRTNQNSQELYKQMRMQQKGEKKPKPLNPKYKRKVSRSEKAKLILEKIFNGYVGFVHGGYLAFTITSMLFGLVFPPSFLVGAAAIAFPAAFFCFAAVANCIRHGSIVSRSQNEESGYKDQLYKYQVKRAELLQQNPDLRGLNVKLQKQHRFEQAAQARRQRMNRKFWHGPWEFIKKFGNRGQEFGRAFKNSTKFVVGILGLCGIVMGASAPIIGFGWPVFVAVGAFAIGFSACAALQYHLNSKRRSRVKKLKTEILNIKNDIRVLKGCAKKVEQQVKPAELTAVSKEVSKESLLAKLPQKKARKARVDKPLALVAKPKPVKVPKEIGPATSLLFQKPQEPKNQRQFFIPARACRGQAASTDSHLQANIPNYLNAAC